MADFDREALLAMPVEDLRDMVKRALKYHMRTRQSMRAVRDEPPAPPVNNPEPTVGEGQVPMGMGAEAERSGMAESQYAPDSTLGAARKAIAAQREARLRRRGDEEDMI